jgi:hypothetical protein
MRQVELISVAELLEQLNLLPNHFIYRGHADATWHLQSSLERVIGSGWSAEAAQKFEDLSIREFKSKFHLYDRENIQPTSKLAWLSVMQHYGVPTRLLDFTASPYVALYFALEAYDPHQSSDFSVFAIDYTALMEQSICKLSERNPSFQETRSSVFEHSDTIFDEVVDTSGCDIAWIAEPRELNARLDRQAGSFLLSGNRDLRIEEALDKPTYAEVEMTKFVIPHDLYTGVFALLRKMNITSKSLYGDLAGLAHSIRMEMQAYSV